MARIQILNLPGEGNPFALVIDQADDMILDAFADRTPPEREYLKTSLGARAIIVVEGTIDIPANDSAFTSTINDANQRLAAVWTGPKADQDQYCSLCPGVPLFSPDAMATHMRKLHPVAGTDAFWEKAADRNGELYSACENQRDELREAVERVRSIPATPQSMDANNRWPPDYLAGYRNALQLVQRAIDNPPAEAGP